MPKSVTGVQMRKGEAVGGRGTAEADPGGCGSKPGPPGATIAGGAGGVLPTAFKEIMSLPRP